MDDATIARPDGRTVAYADFGAETEDATAVIWCHGGPGSRLTPAYVAPAAVEAGLRLVGIDRPGYGGSTPQPGRTIAGWVPDALAVADELGVDRFVIVGNSTGGAYALAVAALAPDRVRGVVPVSAMTDMAYEPARATMSYPHAGAVSDAPDRDAAIAASVASHGIDGSKILESADPDGPSLPTSDLVMLTSPWAQAWLSQVPTVFAHGLEGYADDRIADRGSWDSFDVTAIRSPVIVLHGAADIICDPIHATHTAAIVPGAELRLVEDLGHFSIEDVVVPTVLDLLDRTR